MEPIIWQNRLVKMLDDTTWAMSRAGDHADFDCMSLKLPFKDCAVAGVMAPACMAITHVFKLDEERLLFVGESGMYMIVGNLHDGGRIDYYHR